jgi:hypothetical protein
MAIKDRFIPKEEFMRLLFTKIDGVDTHELSMWLKSQTDDEFVVAPRRFVYTTVSFFEMKAKEMKAPLLAVATKDGVNELLEDFKTIKKYL